ncbi:Galactose oxidase, partial [Tetrabaena socialis]
ANAGYPDGMKSLRTYNRSSTDLQLRKIRDMGWRRWYPTPTLLPSGKVLIMGGTQGVGAGTANNPFWEMYDPTTTSLIPYAMHPGYLDQAEQVYYPFNYVLPSGLVFTFCGRSGFILDSTTNDWQQEVPRLRGYASTQFPFTGTSLMLGLYPERGYQVEIMLFGGQKESTTRNLTTIANRGANRLKLSYDPATRRYTFDGWALENMAIGRVMPDSVLLPNGKVVVLSGANTGLAGDSASGGESRANYPILFAELYDPEAAQGSRFSRLGITRIARMYHSTACLTTNGTIIVAGCDRCYRFVVADGWDFDPSSTKAEYRVEIFSPPYVFMEELRPTITFAQSDTMLYDGLFTLSYTFPTPGLHLTSVVLMAPCSCTHSFNTHQRLLGLVIELDSPDEGIIKVRGPPNINLAPPGMYMIFLVSGNAYSTAVWVKLLRPSPW